MRWLGLVGCMLLASPSWAEDLRRTPVVRAVERATPAVVTIRVEVATASPFLRFSNRQNSSEGSGVIIGADGVVLTNAHVVDGASSITVFLQDERSFEAGIVASDPSIDLAVLQLRGARGLPIIELGDSSDLLLGEPAIAIGNPYGLGLTVSTGVVSSTSRDMNVGQGPTQTYIQTDTAINPGNSGGALVNIYGKLIGINTFIHSVAEGVGFAIPVNRARKIASDLISYGEVQIPWLGLALQDGPSRRGRQMVLVRRVHPGGPAEAAGLLPGDILTAIDGHDVITRSDVNARLAELSVGASVELDTRRNQTPITRTLRGVNAPAGLGETAVKRVWGVEVRAVSDVLEVTSVAKGGTFAIAGLAPGDYIVEVDGRRTRTRTELVEALQRAVQLHRPSAHVSIIRKPYRASVTVGL